MGERAKQLVTNLKLGTGRRINESGLWNFASVDEGNFRRLALLVNYQNFKPNNDFSDAARILVAQFRHLNTVTGTIYDKPNIDQILGKLYEMKVDQFIDIWDQVDLRGDFDLYNYIMEGSIEELMYWHRKRMVLPVFGSQVRLKIEKARMLEVSALTRRYYSDLFIRLPAKISDRLQKTADEIDDLPF